jgi:hypothetical protein
MLIGRKQVIAAAALLCLFLLPGETQAGGGYTPCIVPPVFVRPLLSTPVITTAEIVSPVWAKDRSEKWAIEHADIERPTLVQSVFLEARFDGCSKQSSQKLFVGHHGITTIEGKALLPQGSKDAARIMGGAGSCCGN